MTSAGAIRVHRVLSCVVLGGVVALCVVAYHLGIRNTGYAIGYYHEVFDVGHPGIVNVVTSMALLSVAVVTVLLGLVTGRRAWYVTAGLFVVLAADNLLRLHHLMPTGDVTARLVYWAVFAWLAVRLRPLRHQVPGRVLLLFGIAALVGSELMDVAGNDGRGAAAVFEESLGCLGSWALALAALGMAMSALVPAALPDPAD